MDRYILSVLVKNHSGVLSRIAGLFSRRGYNIDSLSVGETEDEHVSRMTIVLRGDHAVLEQITKQLAKLFDVLHIKELKPGESVYRELLLFKIAADAVKRSEVVQIADIFKAKIIDVDSASISMEITGDQEKISAFMRLVEPFGIKEIVRTGMCAIGRGDETISDDMNGKEL
ncbi:MAG: acetolactate synthase small subunit [Prosthecochloris sp.]|jgi:acetolactate synthase-1/3 small subunit|nr:acetolactate synthase small subunit [Prosthecochloris sp.]